MNLLAMFHRGRVCAELQTTNKKRKQQCCHIVVEQKCVVFGCMDQSVVLLLFFEGGDILHKFVIRNEPNENKLFFEGRAGGRSG